MRLLHPSNPPLPGEVAGARLLDMAPTLLELGGYDLPASMPGRSMVAGGAGAPVMTAEGDAIIRERLSGPGSIS